MVLAAACDLDSDDEDRPDDRGGDNRDDDGGNGNRKRRRVSEDDDDDDDDDEVDPVKVFKKLKKEYYDMGTFHGKPSGCLMYELCDALMKNTVDLLWLACVALTDQFVHERLTNERYQAGVMALEQHLISSGNLGGVTSVTLKDGTKICAPEASRIVHEGEPRLMLLQEWNLFDSMLCSSYMTTKLKTWSDNGTKKLMLLLCSNGVCA